MDIYQLAAMLDGREYYEDITDEEKEQAKASGLVIALCVYDDTLEFHGAINNSVLCDEDKEFFVTEDGRVLDRDDFFGPVTGVPTAPKYVSVKAAWCPDNSSLIWIITTDAEPSAPFMIYEDDEPLYQGVVFSLDSVGMK